MPADERDQVADHGDSGHLWQVRPAPRAAAESLPAPLSQAELRSAFDNAPIGMDVVSPTGVISSGNAGLTALLGRPLPDLVGGTFFDVTHHEDLPAAREACQRLQQGGAQVLRHQCRFLRPDGTVLWVLVSTSRVPDRPGHPAHLIMHVEDISDRWRWKPSSLTGRCTTR
jgi:PAS domain S-box-containing protein